SHHTCDSGKIDANKVCTFAGLRMASGPRDRIGRIGSTSPRCSLFTIHCFTVSFHSFHRFNSEKRQEIRVRDVKPAKNELTQVFGKTAIERVTQAPSRHDDGDAWRN